MDANQFKNLYMAIWTDFIREIQESFKDPHHAAGVLAEIREKFTQQGPGVMMITIDLYATMRSRQETVHRWILLNDIKEMFGGNYPEITTSLSLTGAGPNGIANYLVPTLVMTGPSDLFSGEFVYPAMVVMNCLIKVTREENAYKLGISDKFHTNRVNAKVVNG